MTPQTKIPAPPYNQGPQSLTVYTGGKPITSPRFPALDAAVRAGDWEQVFSLMKPGVAIAQAVAAVVGGYGDLQVDHGSIKYRGRAISNGSVSRILALQKEGMPIDSEARCLASLMRHDDVRVVQGLEDYIQHWKIPRTADGRLVLAKYVRADFMDHHSGTVDWSVGNTVRVGWDGIERDPNQNCSRGLHAAPLEALSNFATFGPVAIELYVWPEHIGAFPSDYKSNGKVRVVEAYVSRVITPDVDVDYLASVAPLPATPVAAVKAARKPKHAKKADKAARRKTLKTSGGKRKKAAIKPAK